MAEINNVIAEASQDLQTIEDFVNLPAGSDVRPRLLPSVNVGTLAGTRDAIFRAGGLPAEAFETYAKMQSDGAALADGKYAAVTDDDDKTKNGLYLKKAGVWIETGYGKSDVDRQYIDNQGANLFAKSEVTKFDAANLPVQRLMNGTGAVTNYLDGTYQTASADGLKVAVTAAGSNGITHYFKTRLIGFNVVTAEFTYSKINGPTSGEGAGVGYLNDSGQYIMYLYSESGTLRKFTNHLPVIIAEGAAGFTVGDTVKIELKSDSVLFYKNNVLQKTVSITDGIKGREIIFGQFGFSQYAVTMTAKSDPIRDYVDNKIAQVAPDIPVDINPKTYYKFDKTGGATNSGLMTVYTKIKDDSYVGFDVAHAVDMSDVVYVDYWRIHKADFYQLTDGAMVATGKKALDAGESEFVWKQNANKVDFTGGYHGDEVVTAITFLANGLPVPLSADIALTACDSFEYIEKSTMHETANKDSDPFIAGHPIVANHIKHTSFYDGGYKTYNKITFNYAGTMSTLYHGISCISKDVAQTVIAGNDYTSQVMTGSGSNYFEEAKARDYVGYNTTNKLSSKATARIINNDVADLASTFFVHDRSVDSKYYRKSPPKNVAVGEVMESEFSCFFSISTAN